VLWRSPIAGIVRNMLLVFGPRSTSYDFGPGHPLTPRRFGPAIDLLRAVGAEPGLAPEPAPDEELLWCHTRRYIEAVKRFSAHPFGPAMAGIGEGGDDPSFAGMHEAGAAVAGGSLRAIEAVLHGDVEHAFHPGGGLHHAMPERASGFCIYNDPALAIARARRDGLRVLYLDLDVHHGDGVQAIHWSDPGVLTLSFHESGRYLFPGTGGVGELGEGVAAGTSVNVPLEPGTGEGPWTAAVRALLPVVAAAFGPDVIVSQHGADSHAWDPLAHLRVTTTAMGEAARLVDLVAHRYAGGRWLATGGGGYDVYRVVPRTWSLVWLAGAHREVPAATPEAWRSRWETEAARYGQVPLPAAFTDAPNAGWPLDGAQEAAEARSDAVVALVRRLAIPRLLRAGRDRGWWDPLAPTAGAAGLAEPSTHSGSPAIIASVDAATWAGLRLAAGVLAPADPAVGHALVAAGLRDGLRATVAVEGTTVVGAALSHLVDGSARADLLALGVAPGRRRRGLAGRVLAAHVAAMPPGEVDLVAEATVAERDPFDPLDGALRRGIARRLLEAAGFRVSPADGPVRGADPAAIAGIRPAGVGS
jgi:acetoin utilization protein AcuC